jgi:ATP-binding cassette subfamily F protein uup
METRGGFEVEHRFASFLSELGIDDLALPMASLSGGMAKKAALARCLAPESDLVFLDEPTNHLDLDTSSGWSGSCFPRTGPSCWSPTTAGSWTTSALPSWRLTGSGCGKYAGGYSDYLANVAAREAEAERH